MIRLVIVAVIGIIALSYLGISLQGILESPAGQANIHYVWGLITNAWAHVIGFVSASPA